MKKLSQNKYLIWLGTAGTGLFYLLYAYQCSMLYYWQLIRLQGLFPSDLNVHIRVALKGRAYSLLPMILAKIQTVTGDNRIVGITLGLITAGTVFLTGQLIHLLLPRRSPLLAHFLAILCSFSASYYIPKWNDYRYLGLQSGNVYHNSTYIGMKFLGLLAIYLYFRFQKHYESGLKPHQWCLFSLSLILVCLAKPNFLVCFAPAMGIYLLIDLIHSKGKTFSKIFLFGLAVIPCVLVLIYEYTFLFPAENGGGLAIRFAYSVSQVCRHPEFAFLQALLFPLWVLLFHIKDLKKDFTYGFSWLMCVISYLEYLFIIETGKRMGHGNLSWGYCFCIFLIFVLSSVRLFRSADGETQKPKPVWFYVVALALWFGHIYYGIEYFQALLMGANFY